MHRSSEFHRAGHSCRPAGPAAGSPSPAAKINSETCVTIRIRRRAPLIVGRLPRHATTSVGNTGNAGKSQPMTALHALGSQRAAPRNAHCRFCRCSGAAPGRRRCRKDPRINGLPGFSEKRSERDPVRGSARRIALPTRCCRAGRKAFRALWKLRRILLRPLATLAIASIVQVRERGHLRSIESPWRQQCPKPLFRACSVDAASAA